MFLKFVLLCVAVVYTYGAQTIPVISERKGGESRQYLTIPSIRRGGPHDALAFAAPVLRAPVQYRAPALAQLERVATLGLTNGLTGGIALGARAHALGPVIAAILTTRTAEVVDVPTPPDVIQPQVLIVEPNLLPVTIEFRSQSSPVNINQVHIPGPPGEVKQTRSEEEPDRVLHEVVKPVIQEVREIIQPFRRITQEVLPVQEEVHSIVARGENRKVLQEVAIPAPAPVAIHAVAAAAPAYAIAQPALQVQPVITSLGQSISPVLSGTIVRAGLIGGARIIEAPAESPAPPEDHPISESEKIEQVRLPAKRDTEGEKQSVNNRPSRHIKRSVIIRNF